MDALIHLLSQNHGAISYLLIFGIGFLENVFPPVPGDTAVVLSAFLIQDGAPLTFAGVLVSVSLGGAAGFFLVYYLTFRWGKEWILRQKWLHFDEIRLQKTDRLFRRYGDFLILGHRFFSGFRTAIAMVAGLSSVNVWKMLALSFVGVFIWNSGLLYLGTAIFKNHRALLDKLKTYNQTVAIALVGILVLFAIIYFLKRKRRKQNK